MKVIVFGIKSLPAFSGPDRVVERLLDHIRPDIDFTVYLLRSGDGFGWRRPGCVYHRIPSLEGKHLKAFVYFALCALHYLLFERGDLVHVHDSSFGFFVPVLKLKPGTRVLGTLHGNPYDRSKWGRLAKWYLRMSELVFVRFCDYITSVAESKVQELQAAGISEIEYIPNGIEPLEAACADEEFRPEEFGLQPGKYLLFACGRLDATKGLHHLIEACPAGRFDLQLFVVGNFTHDKAYAAQIRSLCNGRPDIALLESLLPRPALLSAMKQARLFVFPSEVEAMAMTLLEAISVQVPVVCSSIPENIAVVGPDYPYLANVDTPGDLDLCIERALNDPNLRDTARHLFRSRLEAFSWDRLARRYERCYHAVVRSADSNHRTQPPQS